MKKTKTPPSAKSAPPAEERDEALADRLVALAIDLRESDVYAQLPEPLQKAQADLRRTVRKCLQQQREQALDEALERSFEEDDKAYRVLRENVEELSGTLLLRREDGPELEVNAFVVPLFVRTAGGLRSEQCFQDEQAFAALRDSFQEGGLESRKAQVVLVSHAYHLDEIERIGYCQLNQMVHEACEAMTRRKAPAAEAIARSMRGWPASGFGAEDSALELRFLLGFALKSMDDPFYHVPEKEAAADRYFEARAERFRKWSQQVLPLLRRCLVTDGRDMQIDFLYQDLFHGGKEAALRELEMLGLLNELQQMLETQGLAPQDVSAIVGPTEADDGDALRVSLQAKATNAPLGAIDKPLARSEAVEAAVADLADGLESVGIAEVLLTRRFDIDGAPAGIRPYRR
ncbi:MAG TPA: DUF2863 family protein [Noviherbaspirillum sp.]|uniref:DUF2863 family protein n=1 Tax=Noviherbaspirillum sp. TaxID=1926288 RepID=UPI002D4E69F6|nr:DUF2863 family protein [Noviherbaspirillum sp.]HYD94964.1 DUF2863 family protein [Noviherbaspirillum sp.]